MEDYLEKFIKCSICGNTKEKEIKMNPNEKISKYFTLKDALWLPQWNCLHSPSDTELNNIKQQAALMDQIEDLLNTKIIVHTWIRPILNNPSSPHHGEDYNLLVKGAPHSEHKIGKAIDFHVATISCDEVRKLLEPKLEELKARMEKKPGSAWVHIDCGDVSPGRTRYFIP